jgi:hypothetical protein
MEEGMSRTIGMIEPNDQLEPFEKHTADSKWQFCMCETCQRRRKLIDSAPGMPIDYSVHRKKDEKY